MKKDLENNGRECNLFPEKQPELVTRRTVSLHPAITHRQMLILLTAIDGEIKRISKNNYVIQPRHPAHSNINIVKFPHHKNQLGATGPALPMSNDIREE
ncbi:MAG: hypothetical protein KZQ76_01205 [Candidatus Thiodiazotropha sp. (ex Epidulcina cf. delphinae)]|nr:hypothetical protein [Candidatus Thiodiazotropha sp. (ex Epidulcina cf. delphinae)]